MTATRMTVATDSVGTVTHDWVMSYAALLVSVLALLFTISSFWWLYARPGRLRVYEPTTWSAHLSKDRSALRLPLVLHNTGAASLVVISLRVRFIEGGELMPWEWTRTRVDPQSDDIQDVTAPFSIPGRDTRELVAEFVGSYPGVVPDPRGYPVAVDARSSAADDWQEVLRFDIQLGNMIHPSNYIVYANQHDYLSKREVEEGAQNLANLRRQWGLDASIEAQEGR